MALFSYRHQPFTWSKTSLFSDRLAKIVQGNQSWKLKYFSQAIYRRMNCFSLLSISSVSPPSNPTLPSTGVSHCGYGTFIERQYSADQYKHFAHFLNSGSCLLHGRCSYFRKATLMKTSLCGRCLKKKIKNKYIYIYISTQVALKSVTNTFRIFLAKHSA